MKHSCFIFWLLSFLLRENLWFILTLGLIGLARLQDFCLFILYSFFFSSSGLFVRQ